MSTAAPAKQITVALVGNPNTGKSTLFGALSGVRQRVGNYPGVTVEKKTGRMRHGGRDFLLVDLPGTYSLAPRSPDEMVTVDVLLGRQGDVPSPDVILCIVDASNLERNLYLVSQVLEMGRPVVVALNMTDVAQQRGLKIDTAALQERLGLPVVPLVAHRRQGLDELVASLGEAVDGDPPTSPNPFPQAFQDEVDGLNQTLKESERDWPRFLVERLLLDTGGYLETDEVPENIRSELAAARGRLADAGCPVPAVEPMARYAWVGEVLKGVVEKPTQRPVTAGDKIDRVLTHRVWGTLIFAAVMLLIFQTIFTWAGPFMGWIEAGFEWLSGLAAASLPDGMLQSLVVDGVIAGVGGVLVFLPQIMLLFLFIAILEDCGYLARAAYLMDRLMARVGLSGKSFIPLLSSFACAIPGVMAARVIENRRDRLVTILVAPLMSCSARLPVYVLLIAAFIPYHLLVARLVRVGNYEFTVGVGLQGLTMFTMYLIGIVTAVIVAWVLKKTILPGTTPPFVMELPSYKLPSIRVVVGRVLDRGWAFVKRAGTLIFAVSILVWAASYFPHAPYIEDEVRGEYTAAGVDIENVQRKVRMLETEGEMYAATLEPLQEQTAAFDNEVASRQLENSFLGRAGKFVEPVVRPLGWDWKIGCAAIASFPAREVIVGTLGVIYSLGDGEDEESAGLKESLQDATWAGSDEKVFNVPVALSIMVFFALCAQCAATLAVIKRETNSWGWPVFAFTYMTVLAYLGALATYQVGMWWMG